MRVRLPRVESCLRSTAFLVAFCVVAVIQSAIPFLSVPTLGQALWASGFAQSYVNHGWLSIHATDFGLPNPAAIAFGLSGTFVQGVFMRVTGAAAIDAYTMMVVFYLGFALHGAVAMARRLGAPFSSALLLGVLWLALPVVWAHNDYSMLLLGFALLPLYLYSADTLFDSGTKPPIWMRVCRFVFVCIVAVFMDGYTFVMFAAISAILWMATLISTSSRRQALCQALPTMLFGFVFASSLYISFVGVHDYAHSSIDFFRGFGVDAMMLLEPTRGSMWLWDSIGIGTDRSDQLFWGDASVWMTTFMAPLLVLAIGGFVVSLQRRRAWLLITIAAFGIYFSFGPSLKINSTKNVEGITTPDSGYAMRAKYAVVPTGSAWISEHVPGFRDMRASYRWIGMGALGLWALTALLVIGFRGRGAVVANFVVVCAIATFLPHVCNRLRNSIESRAQAQAINAGLLRSIDAATEDGKTVMFVPWGNDFMVGYLAAGAKFKAFNIGGDKNVQSALAGWSQTMQSLDEAHLPEDDFWRNVRLILLRGETDTVVFPYFDTLWSAHAWPPRDSVLKARRGTLLPIAHRAASSDCFALVNTPLFSVVSLSDAGKQFAARKQSTILTADLAGSLSCTRGAGS